MGDTDLRPSAQPPPDPRADCRRARMTSGRTSRSARPFAVRPDRWRPYRLGGYLRCPPTRTNYTALEAASSPATSRCAQASIALGAPAGLAHTAGGGQRSADRQRGRHPCPRSVSAGLSTPWACWPGSGAGRPTPGSGSAAWPGGGTAGWATLGSGRERGRLACAASAGQSRDGAQRGRGRELAGLGRRRSRAGPELLRAVDGAFV
jgi:hypothetical protein